MQGGAPQLRRHPPSRTLARLLPVARAAGITRLGDITGMDRIGLPAWIAVRPTNRSFSVGMGKGVSAAAAKIGAIMEALELWHAERLPPGETGMATPEETARWTPYLAPPVEGAFAQPIQWLRGTDLLSGRTMRVPRAFISLNFAEQPPRGFRSISTGLAGGLLPAEARHAALSEIAERACDHIFLHEGQAARAARLVDIGSITGRRSRWLLHRIERAGCSVRVSDLTDISGIPCFSARIEDARPASPALLPFVGRVAHSVRDAALFGALAEAVQLRAGLIAGAREDMCAGDYPRDERSAHLHRLGSLFLNPAGAGRPLAAPPAPPPRTIDEAIERLLGALVRLGADCVIECDLTDAGLGIPFLRLIAPALPDSDRWL